MSEPEPLSHSQQILNALEAFCESTEGEYNLGSLSELGARQKGYLRGISTQLQRNLPTTIQVKFLDTLMARLPEEATGHAGAVDTLTQALNAALTPNRKSFTEAEDAADLVSQFSGISGLAKAEITNLVGLYPTYFTRKKGTLDANNMDALVTALNAQEVPLYRQEAYQAACEAFAAGIQHLLTITPAQFTEAANIGERVALFRHGTGLSHSELIGMMGVDDNYFATLKGRGTLPSVENMDSLMHALTAHAEKVPDYRRAAYDAAVNGFAASIEQLRRVGPESSAEAPNLKELVSLLASGTRLPHTRIAELAGVSKDYFYGVKTPNVETLDALMKALAGYAEKVPDHRQAGFRAACEGFAAEVLQFLTVLPEQFAQAPNLKELVSLLASGTGLTHLKLFEMAGASNNYFYERSESRKPPHVEKLDALMGALAKHAEKVPDYRKAVYDAAYEGFAAGIPRFLTIAPEQFAQAPNLKELVSLLASGTGLKSEEIIKMAAIKPATFYGRSDRNEPLDEENTAGLMKALAAHAEKVPAYRLESFKANCAGFFSALGALDKSMLGEAHGNQKGNTNQQGL